MALISDEGFLISSVKWRESSLIVRWFTRDSGKVSIIIRGARRPKSHIGPYLNSFNRLNLQYYLRKGSDLGSLKEADPVETYPSLRTDLDRFAAASFFFEILDKGLPSLEPHPDLFRLTSDFLERMKSEKYKIGDAPFFFLRLVSGMGYEPSVEQCAECGRSGNLDYFDISKGQSLCQKCGKPGADTIPLNKNLRDKISMNLEARNFQKAVTMPFEILSNFYKLLEFHLEYHFESRIKSAKFLIDLLNNQ